MAFLNEKVILNIGGAWPGFCMLPIVCSFLRLHQDMPSTLSKPQSLTARTSLHDLREKNEVISFLLTQRNECPCSFFLLATESLLPFIFSGSYSTSPPQFPLLFFSFLPLALLRQSQFELLLKKSLCCPGCHSFCSHNVVSKRKLQSKLEVVSEKQQRRIGSLNFDFTFYIFQW